MTPTTTQLELSTVRRSWIESAKPVVLERMRGRTFCADDLHEILPEPECCHWFGILTAALSSSKAIRRVGSKPSERAEANGRWVGIYQLNEKEHP